MAIVVKEMYEYGGFWSPYVFRPGRGMPSICSSKVQQQTVKYGNPIFDISDAGNQYPQFFIDFRNKLKLRPALHIDCNRIISQIAQSRDNSPMNPKQTIYLFSFLQSRFRASTGPSNSPSPGQGYMAARASTVRLARSDHSHKEHASHYSNPALHYSEPIGAKHVQHRRS